MADQALMERSLSESAQVATVLALPKARETSALKMADAVKAGLPLKSVDALMPLVGGGAKGGVKILSDSTRRRAMKHRAKRLSPQASEKIYDLARVLAAVLNLFRQDRAKVQQFLTLPHPMLEGRTPLVVATSSHAGADAVLALVNRARAGVAA